jgi:hypothetical protein
MGSAAESRAQQRSYHMRTIHRIAVLGAAMVAFGSIGVGTALADPPSFPGSPPALTDIVSVGSGVTGPLFSGSPTENVAGSLGRL